MVEVTGGLLIEVVSRLENYSSWSREAHIKQKAQSQFSKRKICLTKEKLQHTPAAN